MLKKYVKSTKSVFQKCVSKSVSKRWGKKFVCNKLKKTKMSSKNTNGLTQFCKQHELGRLGEDLCYLQRRDYDSRRPFKWNTYH